MIKGSEAGNNEQGQNRREQYKIQKLEETSEIYFCECGKNYLTFSALYLHARNKHNIKLTTKRNSQNSKIELKGDQTHITYFTLKPSFSSSLQKSSQKSGEPKNQNSSSQHSQPPKHHGLIQMYLNQQQQRLTPHQIEIFRQFQDYFDLLESQHVKGEYDRTADITFFFNEFTIFYFPRSPLFSKCRPGIINEVEATMMKFYNWLKGNELTKYEVLYRPSQPYLTLY